MTKNKKKNKKENLKENDQLMTEESEVQEELQENSDQVENKENIEEIKGKEVIEEIDKLKEDLQALRELSQRRQADFENYKKRTIKIQNDLKKLSIKDFALDIITINDDLLRAIDSAKMISDESSLSFEGYQSFIDGVSMISKRIESTLEKFEIVEIEALGEEFNPVCHEAIEIEENEDVESDLVTKVHQKGFRIDDLIIRSSKVKVTKAKNIKDEQDLEDKSEEK